MEVGTSYSYPAWIFKSQFSAESKLHPSAIIYRGAKFRPNATIIMEKNTFMGSATILVPKLTMRRGSQIGANTVAAGRDEIILGRNTVIGYLCLLLTSTDTPVGKYMNDASPENERKIVRGAIKIGTNCFIGSQSLIMPNVTIADGVVVRAKSYIDKPLKMKNGVYRDNQLLYVRRTNQNGEV